MRTVVQIFYAILTAGTLVFGTEKAHGREFNCVVEVDCSAVEGTSKEVFGELKEKIEDYMSGTKWTDLTFAPGEEIDCRLFLTVKEAGSSRMKGDLQVQMWRPVYNSSYRSPVLNIKDKEVEFDFATGDRLEHNETGWDGGLASLLDYYGWLMLALDGDTFAPKGGQEWWDRVQSVVQGSQSSAYPGWRLFGSGISRGVIFRALTEPSGQLLREALADYHLHGLDLMEQDQAHGRAGVEKALRKVEDAWKKTPMSEGLAVWREAKIDEIADIMSGSPRTERVRIHRLLQPIWGAETERLERILNP